MKVNCFSFKRQRTGHNDDEVATYEFSPDLFFGPFSGDSVTTLVVCSRDMERFEVGKSYTVEIK